MSDDVLTIDFENSVLRVDPIFDMKNNGRTVYSTIKSRWCNFDAMRFHFPVKALTPKGMDPGDPKTPVSMIEQNNWTVNSRHVLKE